MKKLIFIVLFFSCVGCVFAQDFITFKADGIISTGELSLTQNIHSNSFSEKETLATSNVEFALTHGFLICEDDDFSLYSLSGNIGLKHTRILGQKFPFYESWNQRIPSPQTGANEIFSNYQIGDYLLINNTGLTLSGEVSYYGIYIGVGVGGGLAKMKSGFVNNNSQKVTDAGFYFDASFSAGFTLRYVKIYGQFQYSQFAYNSVKWSAQGKKEKDFSSLRGKNLTDGVGISVVVPF
jgi:hypothetical protein